MQRRNKAGKKKKGGSSSSGDGSDYTSEEFDVGHFLGKETLPVLPPQVFSGVPQQCLEV